MSIISLILLTLIMVRVAANDDPVNEQNRDSSLHRRKDDESTDKHAFEVVELSTYSTAEALVTAHELHENVGLREFIEAQRSGITLVSAINMNEFSLENYRIFNTCIRLTTHDINRLQNQTRKSC